MIFKYLLLGTVIYGIYRFSMKGSLKKGDSDTTIQEKNNEEDDYIDYEEIE